MAATEAPEPSLETSQTPLRLLIADDEPVSRSILVELASRWGYESVVAEDGAQTLELLGGKDPPRLAILDWMMPGTSGVNICRQLRARTDEPYTYIIVLTSMQEKEKLVEAMDAGADDFLTKPVQPHELQVRLRAGRRVIEIQQRLIEAREKLRALATKDPLTRLWNRRAILEMLEKQMAAGARRSSGTGRGILMIDIDHFKKVNDRHGHLVGDEVLRQVAERIRRLIRRQDEVGRYGGEEFLVVVSGCTAAALKTAGERLRRGIADAPFETEAGAVRVTLSIGGALMRPVDEETESTLLERADLALYRAKNAGRNRVVLATN